MQEYGDSEKLRFYELDYEPEMRLLKIHSITSNSPAMEPRTGEEKQLKKTQTLKPGKSHPSKTCRILPVWRGSGAEKSLQPAAYRRCGRREQERFYDKPITETILWPCEPSLIWREILTNTREKSCKEKNIRIELPRAVAMAGG